MSYLEIIYEITAYRCSHQTSKAFAFRLTRDLRLKESLLKFIQEQKITAGSLVSGVGCLQAVDIRLADETKTIHLKGPLEILTLSGTLTPAHLHLHISVADRDGRVYGGHLVEGTVLYTCEVCGLQYPNLLFAREHDESTGFTELVVKEISGQ